MVASAPLTPAWTEWKPHPEQIRLWRSRARFRAVAAGRGSGKTEEAKRYLVRSLPIRKTHKPMYFYGGPTRPQAKRIAWDSLQELIPSHWIPKGGISKTELCITLRNGAKLFVLGLDEPARVEGTQWDGCILDESCDLKPKIFDKSVLPALSHKRGWCWRIGVPKRTGPAAAEFRKFYEESLTGEFPDRDAFNWPSADILPPEEIEIARLTLDPKDFNEQYNAIFENAGGGIFYAFNREYNCRPVEYNPNLPLVVGMDFNVNPMAWVVCHRFSHHLEVFWELWKRDTNTPEALNTLYRQFKDHKGGVEFYGDASAKARKTSATESDIKLIANHPGFKKLGRTLHFDRSNPLVRDRFASCNAMLCNDAGQHRVFIDPSRCPHLVEDLENRYYKPGTMEPADKGDLGHITDALGYIIHRLFPIRVRIVVPNAMQSRVVLRGSR